MIFVRAAGVDWRPCSSRKLEYTQSQLRHLSWGPLVTMSLVYKVRTGHCRHTPRKKVLVSNKRPLEGVLSRARVRERVQQGWCGKKFRSKDTELSGKI